MFVHDKGQGLPKMPMHRGLQRVPRILIVEDESLIALDLEHRLARHGYEVVGVVDEFGDAIVAVHEYIPDIILMDICIRGDKDGIETAHAIAGFSDVPVVFLTAFADEATTDRASQVSPYGYLLKPFDDQSLKATLKIALERHTADLWQRLLAATVNSALLGVLLVDVRGESPCIEFCNDAFVSLSGMPRDAVLGQRPCFLLDRDEDAAAGKLLQAIGDRSEAKQVVMLRNKAGAPFWASVSISPVHGRNGLVTHLAIYIEDISSLRQMESALGESQRVELVGRIGAGVAHDMNNVLSAIASFAGLVRARLPMQSSLEADLDEILKASRRGAGLTRKLLSFSRGDDVTGDASCEVNHVIQDTWPMLERLAGSAVKLVLRGESVEMFVRLDATSLEQVLLNLVVNARDAMPDGGVITLSVGYRHVSGATGAAVLTVTDQGGGIAPELMEKIFRPGFSTKPRHQGSGVGLFTCKMLVERAGGSLKAESLPGRGASFTVELPVTHAALLTAPEKTLETVTGHAGGATCLLVEDDHPLRRASARVLETAGFRVVEAASADAAMTMLERLSDSLSLVISDVVLPGGDGYEVLARARELKPSLAVLLMSGSTEYEARPRGMDVPMVWKPFTAASLARWALQTLEQSVSAESVSADAAQTSSSSGAITPLQKMPTAGVSAVPAARSLLSSVSARPAVLLVHTEATERLSLATVLESQGFHVIPARDAHTAFSLLREHEIQVLVFGTGLPDTDELRFVSGLRKHDALLPLVALIPADAAPPVAEALRPRVNGVVHSPVDAAALLAKIENVVAEGQVARLQQMWQLARAGSQPWSNDPDAARALYVSALDGLYMAFQPIVRTHDRSLFAYEALMRCRVAGMGPGDLLPMAESLGLVPELGRRVHELVAQSIQACADPSVRFFVNLHPLEFQEAILLADDQPLLPYAHRVVLEVTERAQLAGGVDLSQTLARLRDAGFRIALDDLGEGYAGLSWLLKLAPDVTKLDMSLTRDIHQSRLKRELVMAMVSVSRRSRSLVVAEGVENEQEATVLVDLGCDLLQGYHFGRPGPLP